MMHPRNQRLLLAATMLGLATGTATAQVMPIGVFTGEFQEDFDFAHSGFVHCIVGRVFSNTADLCTFAAGTGVPTDGGHITGGWSANCLISGNLTPRLFGSSTGYAEYNFDLPIMRFGGYFGAQREDIAAGGGSARFFDEAGVLVATMPIELTFCGAWSWHGWESTVPIKRIQIASIRPGEDRMMMDDMTYDLVAGDPPCYANCDGSTAAPVLTVDDFTCFINEFAAAQSLPHEQQVEHYANCDGSTTQPALTVDDFTCFINEFAAGCP